MRRLLLAALVTSSGCYHIKYTTSARPAPAPNEEKFHHNLVLGFIELDPVDLTKECPGVGFASVEHQYSPLDIGIRVVLGIFPVIDLANAVWQPTHVTVTCAARGGGAPPPAPPAS